jgi:hypothetical protein
LYSKRKEREGKRQQRRGLPETRIFSSYRKLDLYKGFEFNLTKEFIKVTISNPCVYCGYPATGLDRMDNSIGHLMENCVPCCKECNIARMNNFTHEEMKIIGLAIKQVKDNRTNG